MSKGKLINCIECNKTISATADRCPHCGTPSVYFQGVTCDLCQQPLKISESKKIVDRLNGDGRCHPKCYDNNPPQVPKGSGLVDTKWNCPVCSNYSTVFRWEPLDARDSYVSYVNDNNNREVSESRKINWIRTGRIYSSIKIITPSGSVQTSSGNHSETCPKCGESNTFNFNRRDDLYAICHLCHGLLEKKNSYIGSDKGSQVYIHKGLCQTRYEKKLASRYQEKVKKFSKRNGTIALSIGFLILGVFIFVQYFAWYLLGFICFIIAILLKLSVD